MILNMIESWWRDDRGGTASYVGMRGVLPARNLRDQPGLYRSDALVGAFDTAAGFGVSAGLDVAVLLMSTLDSGEVAAPPDVFGSEAIGVLAVLFSADGVGVSSALTSADLVGRILKEEDGSASEFEVRVESDAVACLAVGVMLAGDATFPLVGASTESDFGTLSP